MQVQRDFMVCMRDSSAGTYFFNDKTGFEGATKRILHDELTKLIIF